MWQVLFIQNQHSSVMATDSPAIHVLQEHSWCLQFIRSRVEWSGRRFNGPRTLHPRVISLPYKGWRAACYCCKILSRIALGHSYFITERNSKYFTNKTKRCGITWYLPWNISYYMVCRYVCRHSCVYVRIYWHLDLSQITRITRINILKTVKLPSHEQQGGPVKLCR